MTLERARMLTGELQAVELPEALHEATKLTVYVGRHERVEGRPAYQAVVDLLHQRGVAGATVLLGVDGTAHGARERAGAEPRHVPDTDPSGLGIWQKLMVYTGEQSRHRRRPLAEELIRALRAAGAAGATSLRGIWGYHGDHAPHGDVFWQLRRRLPLLTVIVDTPDRIRDWFDIVDELTDETGLVTSEIVPAYRATGPTLQN